MTTISNYQRKNRNEILIMILFITKYVSLINPFGGMVRVKDIEKEFSSCKCAFLEITPNPLFNGYIKSDVGNDVYKVGWARLDILFPLLRRCRILYFHTIGNFIKFKLSPFCYIGNRKVVLDLHGAQPEELKYSSSYIKALVWSFFGPLTAFSIIASLHSGDRTTAKRKFRRQRQMAWPEKREKYSGSGNRKLPLKYRQTSRFCLHLNAIPNYKLGSIVVVV